MSIVKGEKFGQWTVLSEVTYKVNGHKMIGVECSCGTKNSIRPSTLLNGTSTKCVNCRRKQHAQKLTIPESGWNTYYYRYQQNASSRNLEFLLDKEQFRTIASRNCWYCNSEPEERKLSNSQVIIANGIDRIDSLQNYNTVNCVPCCATCNRMKMDMSVLDFIGHVRKVAKHGLIS